jgi:hypothetical protein
LSDLPQSRAEVPGRGRSAEALLVFVIAIAVALPGLDHVAQKDELNHVLAARVLVGDPLENLPASWNERGWGFTYLVAGMFRVFGESLVTGRIPALVFGAMTVAALFLWVRSEAGRIGAWFAAMLLAFSPLSLQYSQWMRFYTMYALLFLVICLLFYRLFSPLPIGLRQRAALACGALVALYWVEPLTGTGTVIIGLGGLGLWVLLTGGPRLFHGLPSHRTRVCVAVGLLVLAAVAVGTAFQIGLVERLMFRASYVDLWAEAERSNYLFYHDLFFKDYPLLWMLFPFAAAVAIAARPRAALLCICVFCVAFLAHSVVASKAARYLFYVLPMFFAIWGIAVGRSVPWLRSRLQNRFSSMNRPIPPSAYRALGVTILTALVLYPAVIRPALKYGLTMLTTGEAEWTGWGRYHQHPDWVAAGTALAPMVRQADVVIASYDVTAFYALGRIDYLMRRAYSHWVQLLPEFAPGGRLWRPIFSTPESLSRVMACHGNGLVFLERADIRRDVLGIPALVPYLDAHAAKVDLPDDWGMIVYTWQRSEPAPASAGCASLPGPGRPSTIDPFQFAEPEGRR